MTQPSDLARFLATKREQVVAEWAAVIRHLPRWRESDALVTRQAGLQLVDRLIQELQQLHVGNPPAVREEVFDEPELLRRIVLRLGEREGVAFAARDVLMLSDTIDTMIGGSGGAGVSTEGSAALAEAEHARTRAREAEIRSEAFAQRQRFLSEASRLLAESMDYAATLKTVAQLAVPGIADWCVVDLVEENGEMARVAIEHKDPERLELAHRLMEGFPPRAGARAGPAHVVLTGETEFEPQISESRLQEMAPEAERRRLLNALGIHSYISAVLSTRGRVLGTISFFTDTGRSLSADDVEMAEDLARRAATAIDNARLYDQAQRAIRVRDDMLAIVTHDLRTPLSAIVAAAAIQIASASDDENGTRLRQRAELIQRAADHMNRLLRDLTDIGQMDAGRFTIARTPQDPQALVREVVDALQPAAAQHGSRLRADIAGPVPSIEADADRIIQVLSNLVTNAVKVGSSEVVVHLEARPGDVLFTVSDTGPGISAADLPHMFDRYWRGRTANYKGMGLGLPISKQIVDAHGGRIWIESEPGVGSTFFFTLPR